MRNYLRTSLKKNATPPAGVRLIDHLLSNYEWLLSDRPELQSIIKQVIESQIPSIYVGASAFPMPFRSIAYDSDSGETPIDETIVDIKKLYPNARPPFGQCVISCRHNWYHPAETYEHLISVSSSAPQGERISVGIQSIHCWQGKAPGSAYGRTTFEVDLRGELVENGISVGVPNHVLGDSARVNRIKMYSWIDIGIVMQTFAAMNCHGAMLNDCSGELHLTPRRKIRKSIPGVRHKIVTVPFRKRRVNAIPDHGYGGESGIAYHKVPGHSADHTKHGLFGDPNKKIVVWVPEHYRGKPEHGGVTKDYSIGEVLL